MSLTLTRELVFATSVCSSTEITQSSATLISHSVFENFETKKWFVISYFTKAYAFLKSIKSANNLFHKYKRKCNSWSRQSEHESIFPAQLNYKHGSFKVRILNSSVITTSKTRKFCCLLWALDLLLCFYQCKACLTNVQVCEKIKRGHLDEDFGQK